MSAHEDQAVAAVLAGGRGARMGAPKATLELDGRPLIDYPLAAVRAAGLEAVVVAKAASALPALDAPVWCEPDEPVHPLAGVACALERAGGRPVLVVGCDMPLVTPALVGWLAGLDERLAVPSAGGRLHPLLARYGPQLLERLSAALARRAPLQTAVSELRPRVVTEQELQRFGDPERLLLNVNTEADLGRARELLAAGS